MRRRPDPLVVILLQIIIGLGALFIVIALIGLVLLNER